MTQIREDLVQGIVDDAVARVERGEFTADDIDDAIDTVFATADAFDFMIDDELTDEEIQEAAQRVLKEFA